MRLMIDIGHPAHIHLFKVLAQKLISEGHKVLFTCRDREHVEYLLRAYDFEFRNFGQHYKKTYGKIYGLIKNGFQMLYTAMIFKPNLFISHGSTIAAIASFVCRKAHISLEDTFNMEQVKLYYPFTKVILTGDYPHPNIGTKELHYPGYHELAYLHPNVYKPSESVFDRLMVAKGEKYAIIRFIAWNASHDVGQGGFSLENKLILVESLKKYLRVFISSEAALPVELESHRLRIKPEQMHDALAYAHLFIGEGATMAEEAAVLGTPSIYVNSIGLGIIPDLESYGLLKHFSDSLEEQNNAIALATEYARSGTIRMEKAILRDSMLEHRIDVSEFLHWFVLNYPNSEYELRMSNTCKGR